MMMIIIISIIITIMIIIITIITIKYSENNFIENFLLQKKI